MACRGNRNGDSLFNYLKGCKVKIQPWWKHAVTTKILPKEIEPHSWVDPIMMVM